MEVFMPEYAKFTEDMIKTHTILVPDMLPIHFKMLIAIFEELRFCKQKSPHTG